jgi:hypothetical protein
MKEKEPTHILNQIRINRNMHFDPNTEDGLAESAFDRNPTIQEVWIVKDDPKHSRWEFICKTIYRLQVTKKTNKEVERSLFFPYENLWKYFGVDKEK